MLTDIAVEHYEWVAGGDKQHPDPTTATDRANYFLSRLHVLIEGGLVLTNENTYTGQVMQFLREGTMLTARGHSVWVGLGDPKDPDIRPIVAGVLKKARQIVANIRVFMTVYRDPRGWLHTFSCFRFPSPLRCDAPDEDKKQATESLKRIQTAAHLKDRALPELLQLLPRAIFHFQTADSAKGAWGRASAEYPELKDGRTLVDCLEAFTPYTGNLERRFRVLREQKDEERARMLDATVEDLLLVDFAPPSAAMRAVVAKPQDSSPMRAYMKTLGRKHAEGKPRTYNERKAGQKERRDAHVPRDKAVQEKRLRQLGAPESDAAFARKRRIAIGDVLRAGTSERAAVRTRSVWSEVVAEVNAETVVVSAGVKRKAQELTERAQRLETCKKETPLIRAFVADRTLGHSGPPSAPVGVALMRASDVQALAQATKQRFKITFDPVEFIELVLKTRARAARREHLVLVTPAALTDYAVAARLVSAFLGTYRADPTDYVKKGAVCGSAYASRYDRKGLAFKMAVSTAFEKAFPTALSVLRRLATLALSRVELLTEKKLLKEFRKKQAAGAAPVPAHRRPRVFGNEQDRLSAKKKNAPAYATVDEYLSSVDIGRIRDTVCPGFG